MSNFWRSFWEGSDVTRALGAWLTGHKIVRKGSMSEGSIDAWLLPAASTAYDFAREFDMTSVVHAVGFAADLVTVGVPLALLAGWWTGRNRLVVGALMRERRRTVGAQLMPSLGRWRVSKACRGRAKEVALGKRADTVSDELRWLDSLSPHVGRPLSMYGVSADLETGAAEVRDLSRRYSELAARLRGRGLLGSGSSPLISQQAALASSVSERLAVNATFLAGREDSRPSLQITTYDQAVSIELKHVSRGHAPGQTVGALSVTHVHRRLVIAGQLSEQLAEDDEVDCDLLTLTAAQDQAMRDSVRGKNFDGVLPSLRSAVSERDPASGWIRLHLELAETSYSAIVATQYPGARGLGLSAEELTRQAAVLTLSCLPVTRDGFMAIGQRSPHVVNGGALTPAINGNLEMRPRFGVALDHDADGIPDPLQAVSREAVEELALYVDPACLRVLGLSTFDSPEEVGTTALLTSCRTTGTAADLAEQSLQADPVEGLWELDDDLWFVPLPDATERDGEYHDSVDRILAWTLSAQPQDPHTPHLMSALIALFSADLHDRFREGTRTDHEVAAAVSAHLRSLTSSDPAPVPPGTMRIRRGSREALMVDENVVPV